MAIMIPNIPNKFEPASQEGLMFDSLSRLPNDYYVFHSFKISSIRNNIFYESETDFVIFHPKKGILCLEAKAGKAYYEHGCWYYGDGKRMPKGGPYNQASANKWKLMTYIEQSGLSSIIKRCKFLHGVWFPSISDAQLQKILIPSEADRAITLTQDALRNPLDKIETIFEVSLPNGIQTNLNEIESNRLISEILCPKFNIFPAISNSEDLKKIVFHRLLKEQSNILNFLEEQKTAVINGVAGTGKTMIAVEKAKRHSLRGEKVLFLCYNVQLKDFLVENYRYNNIEYYTIAGFACKVCDTPTPDYKKLKNKLEDMYLSATFPYHHVIVDEGQDFGIEDIEESETLDLIKEIIVDSEVENSSFYVFYDRLQLVQSSSIPKYIEFADCKLTLYKNCRNTENIAVTSMRPLTNNKPRLFEGSILGAPAKIFFSNDKQMSLEKLNDRLDALTDEGFQDIVVLTTKTVNKSILSGLTHRGFYRRKYKFTTCRKFKGLEADVVILIDVDGDTFSVDNVMLYYVGASRAKIRLEIISILTDQDCLKIIEERFPSENKIRNPKRRLASSLNAMGYIS